MGLSIFERGRLPRWLPVRQELDTTEITDIPGAVAEAVRAPHIASRIPEGGQVAIAVGSRGIDRIAEVTAAVVAEVRRLGGEPFIVPAMGSHGGATAEGQVAMLAHLGVTEETVGAPIRASMETVVLGHVAGGVPVYFDKIAATLADAVIPIARVKPHTDFKGPTESGLIKMIAIGLGKQHGADTLHAQGDFRFPELLPQVAELSLERARIPFGIALVENGRSRLAHIEAVPAETTYEREKELLQMAREKMARLPGTALDVLIIDRIGKDISGTGADTNVINRYYRGPLAAKPTIQRIIVRDLTDDTDGNASGIGMADVVLRRAAERVDVVKTYMNCITAKKTRGGPHPPHRRHRPAGAVRGPGLLHRRDDGDGPHRPHTRYETPGAALGVGALVGGRAHARRYAHTRRRARAHRLRPPGQVRKRRGRAQAYRHVNA